LLIFPRRAADLLPSYEKIKSSAPDYFNYDPNPPGSSQPTTDLTNPTLRIRTIDPHIYQHSSITPHTRTPYSVRADTRNIRCMTTTYHCINAAAHMAANVSILRASRQIHAEAAELLYSSYTWDFDSHIEAIVPFLRDRTPLARRSIHSLRLVQRPLAYLREFDRCEWSHALRYLARQIRLRRLELAVVAAGCPPAAAAPHGWDCVAPYSAADFAVLRYHDGMEWLRCLEEIGHLQELDVCAVVEHCPPVTSSANMANYVRFSASVGAGFREYLMARMLGKAVVAGVE
jgi:hypothetical protein